MKIAIATKNSGKLKEFEELAKGTPHEFIKIPENIKDLPPETGSTFYENALIKAEFISKQLGIPAIGDDSGLEVDALDGSPGVFSARYSKTGLDNDNCIKLIENLDGLEDDKRSARFRCCLVGYFDGKIIQSNGILEGSIAREFQGTNGFGYDPIFITENGKHLAELEKDEKNTISHRSEAFKKLLIKVSELTNKSFEE